MKILDFIKSSFFLLLLSQNAYSSDYSEEYKIENTKWSISSVCSDNNGTSCNVFAKSSGHLEKITEFPNVPSNVKMESDIISLGFPCGVGCSAFYVYRIGGGLIGPFPRIESIDYEKKIAYVINGNSYESYKVAKKPYLIKKVSQN